MGNIACSCSQGDDEEASVPKSKARLAPLPSLNPYAPLPPEVKSGVLENTDKQNIAEKNEQILNLAEKMAAMSPIFSPTGQRPPYNSRQEEAKDDQIPKDQLESSDFDEFRTQSTIPTKVGNKSFSEISVKSTNSDSKKNGLCTNQPKVKLIYHPCYISQQYSELITIGCKRLQIELANELEKSNDCLTMYIFQDPVVAELSQKLEEFKKEGYPLKVVVLFSSEFHGKPKSREEVVQTFKDYDIVPTVIEKWKVIKSKKQSKTLQDVGHSIMEVIRKAANVKRCSFA